jgi:hypothetical protein
MKRELLKAMRRSGIKTDQIQIHPRFSIKTGYHAKCLDNLLSDEDCLSIGLTYANEKGYRHGFVTIDTTQSNIYQNDIGVVTLCFYKREYLFFTNGVPPLEVGIRGETLYFDNGGWSIERDSMGKEPIHVYSGIPKRVPKELFTETTAIRTALGRVRKTRTFVLDSLLT